jgi:hypothetical protein
MALPGFITGAPAVPQHALYNIDGIGGEYATPYGLPCIYGNWCGPGCGGPGGPIDNVDQCCQSHDRCYDARGYFACSCDRELLGCVWPKMSIWTAKGRAAIAVYGWFSQGWCNPFA